jgi:uncharacterized membrane protein
MVTAHRSRIVPAIIAMGAVIIFLPKCRRAFAVIATCATLTKSKCVNRPIANLIDGISAMEATFFNNIIHGLFLCVTSRAIARVSVVSFAAHTQLLAMHVGAYGAARALFHPSAWQEVTI